MKLYTAENCYCGKHDFFPHIKSYCQKWTRGGPPYCLLRGGLLAQNCPGAKKIHETGIYETSDESICKASIGELKDSSVTPL